MRKVLFQIHLWTGIIIGLYVVVVCVTGSALVFRIDLQRATFPHLFTPTGGEPLPAATILERVQAAFPADRVSGIDAPTSGRPTTLAYVVRGNRFLTILVDPATGRVLGELPDAWVIRTLQDLHFNLLAGRTGRVVNGAGAALLLVMCGTGLVIWWPGFATWRRGFTIEFRRSWTRINREFHGAIGIWTVLLIAMWAVTGVYFVFPSSFRSALNTFVPLTVADTPTSAPAGAADALAKPTWHELVARAEHEAPGQFVQRVVLPSTERAAFLVMFSRVRPMPVGREHLTPVYLDQYTGGVLKTVPRSGRTVGDVVMDWMVPFHVGGLGGTGLRVIWAILALLPPLLVVTGFIMWWTRVVRPRWSAVRSSRSHVPLKPIAGIILLLSIPCVSGAQESRIEVQATGEHVLVSGDTPESARQFALIAAHRQAVRDLVSAVQSRVDLAPLQLTPAQLSAYVAALIDSDDSAIAAASPAASRLRVTLRASFPAAGILERLSALHKDEDAARAVFTAFMQSERLSAYIAEQTGRRGPALSNSSAAAIVTEQLKAATSWNAKRLIARGAAALARTELSTIGGRTPSAEGRRRAKEFIDGALALEPDSPEAHTLLGDWYVDAEQPDAAEAEYRRAIAGNVNYAPGRTKVAEALRLQGKFPEATTELREAIRIDPTFAQAHSDLGMILRAERKVPEAIAEYREAIRLDPRSTDALNGLAITLAGAGQPEEAVATFKAIVAIDPDSTIGYYNLATVLADLDRDVESAAALREVIRINPSHYNARYNLGELLRLEGKYDDSVAQFREYLRLAPETPQNRRNIERAKQFIQKFANP
jgi:uncharacterized iron-regulated membrane protein/tetratricopeptide (TPR) repeat protein